MVQRLIFASRENSSSLLQGCVKRKELSAGRRCHALMGTSGLGLGGFLTDHLYCFFASCGSPVEANVVVKVSGPNVYTWNAIISSQVKLGEGKKALKLYHHMQQEGVKPDKFTFSCMLKACTSMGSIRDGILIHQQIIRRGLQSDVVIGTALVDMYAKCGRIEQARDLFDELPQKNVVTWGAMLAGYVQHGHGDCALELFQKMEAEDLKPSKVTLLCTLKACGIAGEVPQGRLIHDRVIKSGLQSDAMIGNSLVDMYAKIGMLDDACRVFNELPRKNVVSWGAMIAGYVQNGYSGLALDLFQKMQQSDIKPDKVIFSCILNACGNIRAIDQGRLIHDQAVKSGFQSDMIVGSTLVDMYAKCGCIEQAQKVFDGLLNRDAVTWNVMSAGYAKYGDGFPGLALLKEMQKDGIKPNKATFLGILNAVGFLGTTVQTKFLHGHIISLGLDTDVAVGSTLIYLYAKCGSLDDALKVFDSLPSRDQVSWAVMIAGYSICGNYKLAWQCLQEMQKQGIKTSDMIVTSILTACSHAAQVKKGLKVFKSIREDLDLTPHIEHYSCMVDLLSRAGVLREAEDLLQTMPSNPDVIAWTSLLTGCQTYGNIEIGRSSFDQFVQCDPTDASGYLLMSGIYSNCQMQEEADKIRELRNSAGAWKKPGRALLEFNDKVWEFHVGDEGFYDKREIRVMCKKLSTSIKEDGYVPQLDSVLESESDKGMDVP